MSFRLARLNGRKSALNASIENVMLLQCLLSEDSIFELSARIHVPARHRWWKRLPVAFGLPHSMHEDGQFAGNCDIGRFLIALASGCSELHARRR